MAYLATYRSLRWRLSFLLILFLATFAGVLGKVFRTAIVEHRSYIEAAEKQHAFSEILPPERGKIFFQDKYGSLYPAALNQGITAVIASPREIKDPEGVARILGERLKLDVPTLLAKLQKGNDLYEVIAKGIPDQDAEIVRTLSLPGIRLDRGFRRTFPNDTLGAGVIGFVSSDSGKGEYGIEKYYNASLLGQTGFFEGERDASGYWVALGRRILHPPINGSDIILTIDRNIQFKAEELLEGLMKKWQGETALAAVLEPSTGKIVTMAHSPAFNPNEYFKEKDYSRFRMPIVDSQFELGSVFKPITMAAGLNEGLVKPDTVYRDTGIVKFGNSTIRNFDGKAHYDQTMTQVLEKSLNTGAVYVERLLGQARFREYIMRFGFGEKTDIDFPNEVGGNISNLEIGRDVEFATASFGQGIAVTPLQMAGAVGAIANEGRLMKPYIVEKIIDDAGNERVFSPQVKQQVISKETAEAVTKMLVSAVRSGLENRAGVKGYFVAGKTGTAQVPLKDRRGYSDEVIHTFVGYAPAFNPRFLILLQLNKPKGNRFAANTLTPVFHSLAEFILNYYEIPPDEK